MAAILLSAIVFALAYFNGANANFKGVASLFGSGTTSYRTAVYWAALTTAAGAAAGLWWTAELLRAFSGRGLVPDTLIGEPAFLLAVAAGAAVTGGLATRLGFPVSTTHALVGALLGAGLRAAPGDVDWSRLWSAFVQPLLLGPLAAIGLGALLYVVLCRVGLAPDHRTKTLDGLHFTSSGAVCFARGMNDMPKMAALLIGLDGFSAVGGMVLVATAMTMGGLISAKRVADTLAHKITGMNPGQGFAANATTAMLVILGSIKGLPLSTTHVTVGALLGIGITTRQAKWRTVLSVVLAWIITVPCAGVLAAFALTLIRAVP